MARYLFSSHDGFGLGHTRRNTLIAHALLRRDPTAEVTLTRAERRAVEEARAYRPPVADPTEWETPTEARVQATAPVDDHQRADSLPG